MSDGIQRYAFDAFGPSHPGGVIIHDPDGPYVLYDDHLAALAEAERISSKVIADFQRQAREAALREALAEVLRYRDASYLVSSHEWSVISDGADVIQRLIDGGSE